MAASEPSPNVTPDAASQTQAAGTEPGNPDHHGSAPAESRNLFQRWRSVDSAIAFPAVMSIVASLIGAVIGGLVAAYTTQGTVKATQDGIRLQVEAERSAQLREARGRVYQQFLDAMSELDMAYDSWTSCAKVTAYATGEPSSHATIHLPALLGYNWSPDKSSNEPTQTQYEKCAAAEDTYKHMRVDARKGLNGMYAWGSAKALADTRVYLSLYPNLSNCDSGLESANWRRYCRGTWATESSGLTEATVIHLWYLGGRIGDHDLDTPDEPRATDEGAMGAAWLAFSRAYVNPYILPHGASVPLPQRSELQVM